MRTRPRRTETRGALRSLQVRNYRLYCVGQLASLFGTWMQTVALAWLVLELTDSGTQVGLVTAAQFVPVLAFAGPAGVLIDRFDRRRSVISAEATLLVQATLLAALVVSGVVELWMLYVLSFLQGAGNAVEQPGRQALLSELVEDADLPNAVSLNAALFTMARVAGPAAAAVLISVSGVGLCFTINALSFVAIIVALAAMRPAEMHHRPRIERARGQLREGVAYVARSPSVRPLFVSSAILGLLSQNVSVVLPVLAKETFDGGAGVFGAMAAITSAGSCLAAFWMAGASPPSERRIMALAALLGTTLVLAALSPTLLIVLLVLPAMGYAHLGTMVTTNAANQLRSPAVMRGRTIALYFALSSGSAAVGSFALGGLTDAFGPRVALGIGGVVSLAVAWSWSMRVRRELDREPVAATS
jgi:MFS family permease